MTNRQNRRHFLQTAGATTLAAASPSLVQCAAGQKSNDGVNVLLLMTDEQHYRSLSSTGNPYIQTPAMDRIGREGVHGRSMRPLIEGRDVPWRDYAFCQRAGSGRMLRTERYKYSCQPNPKAKVLYDLENDPHEDRNLATDPAHAGTVRQMHERLLEVMHHDGDPMRDRFARAPRSA